MRNRLGADFKGVFSTTMQELWEQNVLTIFDVDSFFEDENDDDSEAMPVAPDFGSKIAQNRKNAKSHGIQTDVTRVFVTIPKNTPMTGENGIVEITEKARNP